MQNGRFVAGASSHSVHCLNEQECAALSQFSFLQEKKKKSPARPRNLANYSGLTSNPWRHHEEAFILQQTDWHCSDDNCNYHEHNK